MLWKMQSIKVSELRDMIWLNGNKVRKRKIVEDGNNKEYGVLHLLVGVKNQSN